MRRSRRMTLFTVALVSMARAVPGSWLGDQKTTGRIDGKVTAAYTNEGFRGASVYVFTLSESKRLRQIDEDAYKRAHAPGTDARQAAHIEANTLDALSDLVPTLPHTALTKTDTKGNYVVKDLPAGRRYYVLAVLVSEDGLFLAAGITPLLNNGQELRFNLRNDNPWQDRFRGR